MNCFLIGFFLINLCLKLIRCSALNGGYVGNYGGFQDGHYSGVGQVHLPYQITNAIDLLTPFHIRIATDGIKHKPILRVPALELAANGQLNHHSLAHLIYGPGIPW